MVAFLGLRRDCSWAPACFRGHLERVGQESGSQESLNSQVLGCYWKQQAAPHGNPSPVPCPGLSLPFGLSEAGPALLGSNFSKLVVSAAGPSLCLFPSSARVCAGVSGGTAASLLSGTKFSHWS